MPPSRSSPSLVAAFLANAKKKVEASSDIPARKAAEGLLAILFKQQRDFIQDPEKRKSLLCPRRSGKSYAASVYLLVTALLTPGSISVFLTLTRDRAKQILWRPLKNLAARFDTEAVANETELSLTLPNGSRIRLGGCETPADIDKWRGEAFHLVLIDETKSFPAALLAELLEEALEPALGDYDGTLAIMGTPGSILEGTFYDATGPHALIPFRDEEGNKRAYARPYAEAEQPQWSGIYFEWSFHSWTVQDNTAKPQLWSRALALKARKGWSDANPKWIREYLGRWITDDGELVYQYNAARNSWTPGPRTRDNPFGLPTGHDWTYVLGVDLGFDAAFALQVAAYSPTHPNYYQVYEYSEPGLVVSQIAGAIKKAQQIAGHIDIMVGDRGGLGKQIFATLAIEHGLSIEAAQKQDKRDHQELLNSDLIDGRCKILPDSKLAWEMSHLVWEVDKKSIRRSGDEATSSKKKEADGLPRDNCDAFLYIRTRVYHHLSQEPEEKPIPGTRAFEEQRLAEELHKMEQAHRRLTEVDNLDSVDEDSWFSNRWGT